MTVLNPVPSTLSGNLTSSSIPNRVVGVVVAAGGPDGRPDLLVDRVRGLGGGKQGREPEEDKRQRAGKHRAPRAGTGRPGRGSAGRSGERPRPGGGGIA